jgi:hypothetical protein
VIDARTEDGEIPPIGDILVNCQDTSVDIRLFRERTTSLSPDMLAVVEKGAHEDGSDWREWETARDDQGHGEKDGAVNLVFLEVEGAIWVEDSEEIVRLSCIVEGIHGHQG